MLLCMMCSSSLHVMEVSETGLLLAGWCLSPFLKIGTIKASFQSLETTPESSDIWKSHVRTGASSVAAVLRMEEGIASWPVALWGFRFFKSLWTPFQSTLMDAIVGISLLPLSGMAVVSSAVNADSKTWFKCWLWPEHHSV